MCVLLSQGQEDAEAGEQGRAAAARGPRDPGDAEAGGQRAGPQGRLLRAAEPVSGHPPSPCSDVCPLQRP